MKSRALTFTLALATALMAVGAQAQDTIVTVNGQPIARSQYIKRMEVLPGVGKNVGGKFFEATPGFLTLQQLINEALMLQLAKDKGVEPSEAQITDEIKFRTDDNPDFVKAFTMLGFTQADLRYDIKVQLSEFNLTTMGINIADAQITQFYENEKRAQFTLPKRHKIRVITIDSPALKKKVDDQLAAGKSFADVAAELSIDISTKYDGGLMGVIPEDNLSGTIKAIVNGMKEGQSSIWVPGQTQGVEIKFFLEKTWQSEVMPLDAKLKQRIRRKMMVDRGNVKNDIEKMMANQRANARIEYSGTPFDGQLKQLFGPDK
ncbi:MAG: SurA N-terminal domain-containing protein [Fimbriimonadaceae bacterium]|nr:SurA N-terminal domain-containing protein [Fimbriimonadaceae bacterium]